jgi:hypothetical protein
MLPAIGRTRAMRGVTPLLLRRALGTTIDVRPRSVTEGERPIIVPPPPSSTDAQQQANSNGSGSSSGAEGKQQAGSGAATEAKGWGLFPSDIVEHLDRYVVGQEEAKKATAIALRSRWRRSQLPEDIRAEVAPTNMLFKGPTGSGKTEIARRLSTLADAPFIKVEATRYTETG